MKHGMVELDAFDIQLSVEEADDVDVDVDGGNADIRHGPPFGGEVDAQVVDANAPKARDRDRIRVQPDTRTGFGGFESHLADKFQAVLDKQRDCGEQPAEYE